MDFMNYLAAVGKVRYGKVDVSEAREDVKADLHQGEQIEVMYDRLFPSSELYFTNSGIRCYDRNMASTITSQKSWNYKKIAGEPTYQRRATEFGSYDYNVILKYLSAGFGGVQDITLTFTSAKEAREVCKYISEKVMQAHNLCGAGDVSAEKTLGSPLISESIKQKATKSAPVKEVIQGIVENTRTRKLTKEEAARILAEMSAGAKNPIISGR